MTTSTLPPWLNEGEPVAILDDRYTTGVGGYTEVHEATVVKVTPQQIKVRARTYAGGKDVAFKRDTLKKVGGSGTAARLAHPNAPGAIRARKVSEIRELARSVGPILDKAGAAVRAANSPTRLNEDLTRELEHLLVTLGGLRDDVTVTHARLLRIRGDLSQ